MSKIGNIIKKRRMEMGLSQRKLAAQMGWHSPEFLSSIETGAKPLPPASYREVCEALDLPLHRFVKIRVDEFREFLDREINKANQQG